MDLQTLQKINALDRRIAAMEEVLRSQGILERPPEPPRPAELPTVDATVITRFRASMSHPFTVIASFECPSCGKQEERVQFTTGENGAMVTTACASCKQNLRVRLAWDIRMK